MVMTVLAALSLMALVAGCGDDDDDDGGEAGETTAATAAPAEEQTTIEMGDYYFRPDDVSVKAGALGITAPNVGEVEHELVLFKTDEDPADLPVSGGEVDEDALEEQGAEEVGEVEAEPGDTAEGTFELESGSYAMICNIPGHYAKGMYGGLTAK
jgi:uncharacterized cupredoxin-like copper-binding protein